MLSNAKVKHETKKTDGENITYAREGEITRVQMYEAPAKRGRRDSRRHW